MSKNGYFATIPVRFFVYSQELDDQDDDDPIIEVNEYEFLKAEGYITYERHTKAENGVSKFVLLRCQRHREGA